VLVRVGVVLSRPVWFSKIQVCRYCEREEIEQKNQRYLLEVGFVQSSVKVAKTLGSSDCNLPIWGINTLVAPNRYKVLPSPSTFKLKVSLLGYPCLASRKIMLSNHVRGKLLWVIKTCDLKGHDLANLSRYKTCLLSWLNCQKKTYNRLLVALVVRVVGKTDDN
jgi:hypothetical protein